MSELLWQADVKFGGGPISILCKDGEWSATGEGGDVVLAQMQSKLDDMTRDLEYNPAICTPLWSDLWAAALRSVVPVYGIDSNFALEDVPDDAVF